MARHPTSVRLNDEEIACLKFLSEYYGKISDADAIRRIIVEKAREYQRKERASKMNDLRKNSQNIEIPQDYKDSLSERDAFLQTCFDEMFNLSMVCTPEELAEFQTEYDLEGCKAFFEDNYNG